MTIAVYVILRRLVHFEDFTFLSVNVASSVYLYGLKVETFFINFQFIFSFL